MRIWLLMALSALLTLMPSCAAQTTVPNAVRLHVVANSDSREDQRVKLEVRDALIREFGQMLCNARSAEDCFAAIRDNMEYIETAAENVLSDKGFSYGADLKCGTYDYPTRLYENAVLPAGEYRSLEVVLGDGNGKNWWCVIYPNMCIIKNDDETSGLDALSSADFTEYEEQDIVLKSVILEKLFSIKTPQPDDEALLRLLKSLGIR